MIRISTVLCLLAASLSAAKPEHPFFAFCINTHDAKHRTFEQQVEMLKELGYNGIGQVGLDQVEERVKSLDGAHLDLFQLYVGVDVSPEAKQPYDPRLKQILPLLKGRCTQVALSLPGGKASDPKLDGHAVELIREIATLADASETTIVLYHHDGCWMETFQDAMRVADKVNRPNVGVMFNLSHWLRDSKERDYRTLLEQAIPRLRAVSINGADEFDPQPGWGKYVQPLDAGTFDVGGFLKTLYGLGYKGPVGLQCYGIGGDAREHLARSIAKWRKLNEPADGCGNHDVPVQPSP